jgi:hypothetical protein
MQQKFAHYAHETKHRHIEFKAQPPSPSQGDAPVLANINLLRMYVMGLDAYTNQR